MSQARRAILSMFQFTLPRGERLDCLQGGVEGDGVSIHAPAGGATVCLLWNIASL